MLVVDGPLRSIRRSLEPHHRVFGVATPRNSPGRKASQELVTRVIVRRIRGSKLLGSSVFAGGTAAEFAGIKCEGPWFGTCRPNGRERPPLSRVGVSTAVRNRLGRNRFNVRACVFGISHRRIRGVGLTHTYA